MDLVIGGVAVVDLAVDGHGSVGRHRAVVQQLLEIGAVIFVVALGDARRTVALLGGRLIGILSGEGDGGRVLVHLLEDELEDVNGAKGNGGKQTGAISAKQVIQGATAAVIVEQSGLSRQKSEVFRDETGSPGGDAVQGLPGQQEIAEQDTQDRGGWQVPLAAGSGGSQVRRRPPEIHGECRRAALAQRG